MEKNKIKQYLNEHQNDQKVFEYNHFNLAICHVLLENYVEANVLFREAIVRMLSPNPIWKASAQPEWLIDIALMSGRSDLYPAIKEELNVMRINSSIIHPVGTSLPAQYCYSVMEILYPETGNILEWIENLLKRPKVKEFYAIGQCLQSIVKIDQIGFDQSLCAILKSHEGKAKHGELRWTPEGWLCLSAMSLSFIAIQKRLRVEIENDYLSIGYLTFLSGNKVT
jgi:hypothetical protein